MSVLVVVADGTEEMEAVIVIDFLRRANVFYLFISVDQRVCRWLGGIKPCCMLKRRTVNP